MQLAPHAYTQGGSLLNWLVFSSLSHPNNDANFGHNHKVYLLSLNSIYAIKTTFFEKILSTSSLMRVNWCQRISSVHRNLSFKRINIPPPIQHAVYAVLLAILNSSHTEYPFTIISHSFLYSHPPSFLIIAIIICTDTTQKEIRRGIKSIYREQLNYICFDIRFTPWSIDMSV